MQKQAWNHRLRNKTPHSLPTLAGQQDIVQGDVGLLLPVAHVHTSCCSLLPRTVLVAGPDSVTASEAPVMSYLPKYLPHSPGRSMEREMTSLPLLGDPGCYGPWNLKLLTMDPHQQTEKEEPKRALPTPHSSATSHVALRYRALSTCGPLCHAT